MFRQTCELEPITEVWLVASRVVRKKLFLSVAKNVMLPFSCAAKMLSGRFIVRPMQPRAGDISRNFVSHGIERNDEACARINSGCRLAMQRDVLLTPKEAAARLRCGLTSIYALMANGELPYVSFLSTRRVEESALEEFIATHRIAPRTSPRRWGQRGQTIK